MKYLLLCSVRGSTCSKQSLFMPLAVVLSCNVNNIASNTREFLGSCKVQYFSGLENLSMYDLLLMCTWKKLCDKHMYHPLSVLSRLSAKKPYLKHRFCLSTPLLVCSLTSKRSILNSRTQRCNENDT